MNGRGVWIAAIAFFLGVALLAAGAAIDEFMQPTDPTLKSTGLSLIALGLTLLFTGIGLYIAVEAAPREM